MNRQHMKPLKRAQYWALFLSLSFCCMAKAQIPGTPYFINNPIIPANLILSQNRTYLVSSIYDQDYLPYTLPTGVATTSAQAADGTNEPVTVDFQGSITTAGITVSIPVTATGSGTLLPYSNTITIPASVTEDGIGRDLTLSWGLQPYTSSTQFITATIKAVGGTLNAKKLDINAGLGNSYLGILMGQFTYPYNNAGNTTTYSVRDISGIPDKMFGLADNSGNTTTHRMIYVPVLGEDGNIWLNNNLGADYANLSKPVFSPAQQAISLNDFRAFGSFFQWGRKPDGHELLTWTSASNVGSVYGTTTTRSDNPTHALFIYGVDNWQITPNNALWATESSANNPCPPGFRVSKITELTTFFSAAGITDGSKAYSSILKLTITGDRVWSSALFEHLNVYGYLWSNSNNYIYISTSGIGVLSDRVTYGLPVRCIKD